MAWLKHLILPTIVLTLISIASTIRIVRNAMIDALNQDYIRTARAKGLKEKVVVYSHAFRNALIPVSTVVVGTVFSLFAGSTITETIFAWNGIGKVLISAINARRHHAHLHHEHLLLPGERAGGAGVGYSVRPDRSPRTLS